MFISNFFNSTSFNPFILFGACILSFQISAQQVSKKDILIDLEYLKASLEETHIDLYAYTSKQAFDQNYTEVRNQIKDDSLSFPEVLKLFQKVISKANNAHTRIEFSDYVEPYRTYAYSDGTLFPLEVAIEDGKALIRKNWSNNTHIKIDAELKSINGMSINEVFEKIYPQISAERLYFKNAQLEAFSLPRYYWLVFGEEDKFKVEIIQNGHSTIHTLEPIKALDDYEFKRNEILKEDWNIKFLSPSSVYLRPGKFGGDDVNFQRFIDSAFVEIKANKCENLIIDLRNHSGGDNSFSDYLVSYIADKPFKWTSEFKLKTSALLKEDVKKYRDTTQAFWNSALAHKNGEIYTYNFELYEPQPLEKRYQGEVYVLVNRQSYSQSTVAAAQIQDYGFGKIVGEETAEYPNLLASIFTYTLPKTKIKVDIPKGKIQRTSGFENKKGVIPDIIIIDHLLDETDEILDELLKKINLE